MLTISVPVATVQWRNGDHEVGRLMSHLHGIIGNSSRPGRQVLRARTDARRAGYDARVRYRVGI